MLKPPSLWKRSLRQAMRFRRCPYSSGRLSGRMCSRPCSLSSPSSLERSPYVKPPVAKLHHNARKAVKHFPWDAYGRRCKAGNCFVRIVSVQGRIYGVPGVHRLKKYLCLALLAHLPDYYAVRALAQGIYKKVKHAHLALPFGVAFPCNHWDPLEEAWKRKLPCILY